MGLRTEAFKALVTGRSAGLTRFFTSRYPAPPDRNTQEWLETYGRNPRLSPVTKIATDLSSLTGKLYRIDKYGEGTEIDAHPFLDFFERPNPMPEITASAFWRLMEIYLLIKGEAYALIERSRNGFPAELWPIPPHWVIQTPFVNRPYYLIRNGNGEMQPVPISEVFVQKELNPLNPYRRGLGMAEAVVDEIETYEYMLKWAKKIFFNDATPPTIIAAPGMNKDAFDRFKTAWDDRHQGIGNAHRIGFIPNEASAIRLTDSQREMDFTQSKKDLREEVNSHFAIPPEVMGLVENSNRATAGQSKIIYAENVLSPRVLARQDAINAQLVSCFGDDLYYEYDDIIPKDQEFTLQVANDGAARSAATVNEWREKNGFDTVPWGDIVYVPVSVTPVRPDELLSDSARQNDSISGPPS